MHCVSTYAGLDFGVFGGCHYLFRNQPIPKIDFTAHKELFRNTDFTVEFRKIANVLYGTERTDRVTQNMSFFTRLSIFYRKGRVNQI